MLTERERQEVRRTAKRHRAQPGIVNNTSIPNKGTNDNNGNPFLGLGRQKIADNAIGSVELDSTSVNTTHLIDKAATAGKIASNAHSGDPLGNANMNDDPLRAISGDHVRTKTLEGFHFKDETISARALGVGLGGLGGKVNAFNQIDWGSGAPPVPAGKVAAGYEYSKLKNRPNLGKFLTRNDFRADGTLKR